MQMQKNLMISGLFLVLILGVLSGCTQGPQNNDRYINETYGFEIIPPSGWITNENTLDPVKFFCPDQNEYQINLAIKEPILSNDTVLNVGRQLIEYYSQTFFKNFTLISSTEKNINGLNAFEIVYSEGQEPNMLQHKQVLFQTNNKIFSVTYTSLVDTYDTYLSAVDQSINSFVII